MDESDRRIDTTPVNWSDLGVSDLPTGTVTLLLADVEGSTGLWQTQPSEMTAAVARLDATLATLVGAHQGTRPVEQGEGDSFVIAFARASDAVACAFELQRAPLAPIKLRIGLHTGEIQLRDQANYIGPTINRAGRVRDLAHGGQTVLTGVTEELVLDHLPDGTWLTNLGSHKLRDIPRPERIVQLSHPDLRIDFPPLRVPTPVVTQALPAQLTSFVGRSAEIAELIGIVAENRFVTLTGAGGVGKTRLSVELSVQVAEDYRGAIHYVDLAPLTDPGLVEGAVARSMGVPDQPGLPTIETLIRRIGGRRVLIVLDKCEHLLEATAALVGALLSNCPAARLLATSREPLRVAAEMTWQVPSLSLADEAVELFADRAGHVRPDFTVTDANAETVMEICRRLDGIPLAIELAAARIRALSPGEILDSLHDRFRLLTGGARTAVRRQQTLQASVDWSHSLLTQAELALFRRLSVFAAGCDLEAALAVCGSGEVQRYQVLDQLTLLVEKSLVQTEIVRDRTRYRMLETVRQYAMEKLSESGEAATIRQAHSDYYSALAAELEAPNRDDFRHRVEQIEGEFDNVRAAFAWHRETGSASRAMELASALQPLWQGRGRLGEGLTWFEAILRDEQLDPAAVPPAVFARAWADKATLDSYVSATDSLAQARNAVAIARDIGDQALLARALMAYGFLMGYDVEAAAPYFAEAMGLAREVGDDWRLSQLLARQAFAAAMAGEPVTATVLGEEGGDLADAIGDWFDGNLCRWSIGMAKMFRAELPGSIDLYRAVFADAQGDHDAVCMLTCLVSQGSALIFQGDFAGAQDVARAAIAVGSELDFAFEGAGATILAFASAAAGDGLAAQEVSAAAWQDPFVQRGTVAISCIALSALAAGDLPDAQKLADESVATLVGWHKMWALTIRSFIALASRDFERAQRDACESLSIGVENGSRLCVPHTLECLAQLAIRAGRCVEGVRLLAAADAIRQRTGEATFPVFDEGNQSALTAARDELGEEAFRTAWSEGDALSTDEAISYALRGHGERKRPPTGWAALTPAEIDVVRLVSEGLPSKEIAKRLFISPRTVQTHLTHIYTKLGLTSRVQLAQEVARH